jgi:hypothetical protein
MNIKLFENWLAEEETQTITWEESDEISDTPGPDANAVLVYSEPRVDVKKHPSKDKFNLIDIVNPSGPTYTYRIMGTTWTGETKLNFKYLKKEKDGGLTFGRYADGYIDPYTVEYSKVKSLLNSLKTGVKSYNAALGVNFYKI